MPRIVRNFWISADIDGRANILSGGPRSKEGGLTLRINMRDNGVLRGVFRIEGRVSDDGEKLTLSISPGKALNTKLYQITTCR